MLELSYKQSVQQTLGKQATIGERTKLIALSLFIKGVLLPHIQPHNIRTGSMGEYDNQKDGKSNTENTK